MTIFERVELAIKSYFEILVNFLSVYFLIFYDKWQEIVDAFIYSIGINTLTNISYEIEDIEMLNINKLLVNLQILTVLSLVILSLAMYASNSKELRRGDLKK